jgi:hypothetical protein
VRRPAHRVVGATLAQMDAGTLRRNRCWFGGGTRIVLDLDEYRVSADLDFLVSDPRGYSEIRSLVRQRGPASLFRPGAAVRFPREPLTDQYGVRFPVQLAEGGSLKLEIVREARIELGDGVPTPWSPVDCLARADVLAEKLLANSDRWLDASVLSRDLVDLGAARLAWGPLPSPAFDKAAAAYGQGVRSDLSRAAERFLAPAQADYRQRCFTGLGADDPTRLLDGVRRLAADLGSG